MVIQAVLGVIMTHLLTHRSFLRRSGIDWKDLGFQGKQLQLFC